jgi:hypothetical protein
MPRRKCCVNFEGCVLPEPACFPADGEDIVLSRLGFRISLGPGSLNKLTRRGLICLLEGNVPGIPILREIVPHGWLRPLARWHGRVVNKARNSPRTTVLRPPGHAAHCERSCDL